MPRPRAACPRRHMRRRYAARTARPVDRGRRPSRARRTMTGPAWAGLVDESLGLDLAIEVRRTEGGLAQPLQEASPRAIDHAEDAAARCGAQVDQADVEQRRATVAHTTARQREVLSVVALVRRARGGRLVVVAPRLVATLDIVLHHHLELREERPSEEGVGVLREIYVGVGPQHPVA
eukprot:scaffold118429_cov59-Phaeocystis_antarctica.AAC.9